MRKPSQLIEDHARLYAGGEQKLGDVLPFHGVRPRLCIDQVELQMLRDGVRAFRFSDHPAAKEQPYYELQKKLENLLQEVSDVR